MSNRIMICMISSLIVCFGCFLSHKCYALEPHEILVLVNENVEHSLSLAKYYMEKRCLPEDNIIKLRLTDKEWCRRDDYDKKVVIPVRKYLMEKDHARRIRCILTMYGIPIKIAAPELSPGDEKEMEKLQKEKSRLEALLKDLKAPENEQAGSLDHELDNIKKRITLMERKDSDASFDSEIALILKEDYPLHMWMPNPFFVGYRSEEMETQRADVLMVSRLDGPSDKVVKRIIDDSIAVENTGLKGTAYFDARWPRPETTQMKKSGLGYEYYDGSIHRAADRVKQSGLMPVVVNDKEELFKKGECQDAALYCGWYSLAMYVDAFQWKAGAIGYHIASAECKTLKNENSNVWCKKMLDHGIAATIGPVGEPYVQAFPIPEIFFEFLMDGYWTLAECYALSQPFWSWKMVLIGDPLYRPFKYKSK